MKKEKKKTKRDSLSAACYRNGQNIFMLGMFIVTFCQYCFRGRGHGFVYYRLPLRMFHSFLQSIDNQNVLGGREQRGKGMETNRFTPNAL